MIRLLISVEQRDGHMYTKIVSRNMDHATDAEEAEIRGIVEGIQQRIIDDGGDATFVERPAASDDAIDAPPL